VIDFTDTETVCSNEIEELAKSVRDSIIPKKMKMNFNSFTDIFSPRYTVQVQFCTQPMYVSDMLCLNIYTFRGILYDENTVQQ
jgi:hypothetical protein